MVEVGCLSLRPREVGLGRGDGGRERHTKGGGSPRAVNIAENLSKLTPVRGLSARRGWIRRENED
jgi:hypothetical protein